MWVGGQDSICDLIFTLGINNPVLLHVCKTGHFLITTVCTERHSDKFKLSTPITPDTDFQMNQSAPAANTGGWNKGRENKRQRASPLAEKEAGLFSVNHKAKQWHFLCAVSWSLVLNESASTQLWIPTFNNQNQKPKQKYLSLIYWVIFADSPYQVNKKGLGFKADRLWVLGMRLTFSKMLLWQNLYYLDNGQYKLLKWVKMVFCATKTALKTGRGRAVHFFVCAEHKQTTNLSFSFWTWTFFLSIQLQESSPIFDKVSKLR